MKHLNEYIIEQQTNEGLLDKVKRLIYKFRNWLSGIDNWSAINRYHDYDYDFINNDKFKPNNIKFRQISNLQTLKNVINKKSDIKNNKGWWVIEHDLQQYEKYMNTDTIVFMNIIYNNETMCGIVIYDVNAQQFRKDCDDKEHDDFLHIYSSQIKQDFKNTNIYKMFLDKLQEQIKNDDNIKGITASYTVKDMRKAYSRFNFKPYDDNLMELVIKQ